MKKYLKKTGQWLLPAIMMLLTFFVLKCVLLIGYVPTASMEPTLEKGSYIVGCRFYSKLEAEDIIIFRHDGNLLVKRIVAVEGDTIEKNGSSLTVPEGRYYVLGDNTDNSYDSRYWADPFVREDDVVAKLIY